MICRLIAPQTETPDRLLASSAVFSGSANPQICKATIKEKYVAWPRKGIGLSRCANGSSNSYYASSGDCG